MVGSGGTVGVFEVEVVIAGFDVGHADFPCVGTFFAIFEVKAASATLRRAKPLADGVEMLVS